MPALKRNVIEKDDATLRGVSMKEGKGHVSQLGGDIAITALLKDAVESCERLRKYALVTKMLRTLETYNPITETLYGTIGERIHYYLLKRKYETLDSE